MLGLQWFGTWAELLPCRFRRMLMRVDRLRPQPDEEETETSGQRPTPHDRPHSGVQSLPPFAPRMQDAALTPGSRGVWVCVFLEDVTVELALGG